MHRFHFGRHHAAPAHDWRGFTRMGRHGPGRRGRPGRIFEHGDLRYVLLYLIAEKPSHGYELIKAIEDKVGGVYSPSPGVIYPTLTLLEELGYIRGVASEGARRAFEITEEGRAALDKNKALVETIFGRVAEFVERATGHTPPQIVRAMENLRLALKLKLERGKLSEGQIADVAAALDAAAATVERD